MRNFFLIIGSLLLLPTGICAQDIIERCQHTQEVNRVLETDPEQFENIELARKRTEAALQNPRSSSRAIYEIPVIFHVIYNNAEQNISMDAILSQMDVLNADYKAQNSDFSQVPAHFSGLAANAEIHFCLAHVDPDGNWSDGVTRTETSTTVWSGGTGMMSSAGGGHDPWPHSDYLNVWVVNLNPQLLGYAYPPGSNPNGMVIGYKNFGTVGSYLSNIYNKGRTATHEIGHWLDLFHPWGPNFENPDCTDSDLVDDTPVQEEPNYGCPIGNVVSCNNGPNGDMYMNFMDYVDDQCMVFFTEGQKARMRATLEGARASILTSEGCNTTSVYESELSKQINVYPNPASATIRLDAAPWIGNSFSIRILNNLGQEIIDLGNVTNDRSKLQFDIDALEQGLYLLEVQSNKERAVKRFTKI